MSKSELPIATTIKESIDNKTIKKVYSTLSKYEDDLLKAIDIARELKRGIMLGSVSREHQLKMCDEIIGRIEA